MTPSVQRKLKKEFMRWGLDKAMQGEPSQVLAIQERSRNWVMPDGHATILRKIKTSEMVDPGNLIGISAYPHSSLQ